MISRRMNNNNVHILSAGHTYMYLTIFRALLRCSGDWYTGSICMLDILHYCTNIYACNHVQSKEFSSTLSVLDAPVHI